MSQATGLLQQTEAMLSNLSNAGRHQDEGEIK